MKPPFYPLFKHILDSTVWREGPHATRLIWFALLELADDEGNVFATLPGLASAVEVMVPDAEAAIARLLAPDACNNYSCSENGAHIEVIPDGWHIFPSFYASAEVIYTEVGI